LGVEGGTVGEISALTRVAVWSRVGIEGGSRGSSSREDLGVEGGTVGEISGLTRLAVRETRGLTSISVGVDGGPDQGAVGVQWGSNGGLLGGKFGRVQFVMDTTKYYLLPFPNLLTSIRQQLSLPSLAVCRPHLRLPHFSTAPQQSTTSYTPPASPSCLSGRVLPSNVSPSSTITQHPPASRT
jgi:hypothetical protein